MRYRGEVHRTDADNLLVNVGYWETHRAAVMACEENARQSLKFSERWRGCWEARAESHWYRILVSRD